MQILNLDVPIYALPYYVKIKWKKVQIDVPKLKEKWPDKRLNGWVEKFKKRFAKMYDCNIFLKCISNFKQCLLIKICIPMTSLNTNTTHIRVQVLRK